VILIQEKTRTFNNNEVKWSQYKRWNNRTRKL